MIWVVAKIGEIADVVTKGTTPTTYGMPFTNSGVNFIKAEALNGDTSLERSGFTFISDSTHEKLRRSILNENDVLITIAGAQVGRCGFVRKEHLPANTNQAVGIIRVKSELTNPAFVYYFFKNPRTFQKIQGLGGQAAQPNINLELLKGFQLSLPDKRTQDAVVEHLSAYDDLIENNRRRIELLEAAARTLYREWFVHFRFTRYEHVKIINGLPDGWDRCKILEFGQVKTGKTPSTEDSSNYGGEIPFIKTPDMHGNIFILKTGASLSEKGAKLQASKTIPAKSILISCIGTIGVVSITTREAQFNQQINALLPNESTHVFYLYFALSDLKKEMEAIGGGATMANVNKSKFEKLKLLKPSDIVLRQFHDYCSPVFQQIEILSVQNTKLRDVRDLLLPRLMNGEIAV